MKNRHRAAGEMITESTGGMGDTAERLLFAAL